MRTIDEFGFGDPDITPEDFLTEENVVQLGYPPFRIDLLSSIDGVGFDEAWPERILVDVGKLPMNVIGREALLRNKRSSGRARDRDDLENLQQT